MAITYTIIVGFGCLLSGIAIGAIVERKSWKCRAIPKGGSSAHYCDGEFYYIIEEGYFCREYIRRVEEPKPRIDPFKVI